MITVAIIASSIAHYRIPLLNRLAQIPNLKIRALVSEESETARDWAVSLQDAAFEWQAFPKLLIPVHTRRAQDTQLFFSPHLWQHLAQNRYDIVIALGWTMPNTAMALLIRRLQRLPIWLWDTSIAHPPSRLKRALMPLIRRYFGAFDGTCAASTAAKAYLVSMGARSERAIVLPQTIDNAFFETQAARAREQRAELKRALGISTSQVILYCGRFVPGKGLLELVDVFARIAVRNENVSLLYVGDGPLRSELVARSHTHPASERILFHPHVPNVELPKMYAVSDVFVLYSEYDTFGVVIAEAMACSLPIVTTPNVGAVQDLVQEGVNGLLVSYGDSDGLEHALETLLQNDERRNEMGAASHRIISTWDLDLAAQHFNQLVALSLEK